MPVKSESRFQAEYYGKQFVFDSKIKQAIGSSASRLLKEGCTKVSIEVSHGKFLMYSLEGELLSARHVNLVINISTLGVHREEGFMVCTWKAPRTINQQTCGDSVNVEVLKLSSDNQVSELHNAVAEQKRKSKNQNSEEGIECWSHLYEVLYLGKMKVSHKKAPPSFVDDALKKISDKKKVSPSGSVISGISEQDEAQPKENQEDLDPLAATKVQSTKTSSQLTPTNSHLTMSTQMSASSSNGQMSSSASSGHMSATNGQMSNGCQSSCGNFTLGSTKSMTTSSSVSDFKPSLASQVSAPQVNPSSRTGSSNRGSLQKTMSLCDVVQMSKQQNNLHEEWEGGGEWKGTPNRTMLLHIASKELRLISPESKKMLWSKQLKQISFCSVGIQSRQNFGFICKESDEKRGYYGYIFQCSEESIVEEIMLGMNSAFHSNTEDHDNKTNRMSEEQKCGHCPIIWFNKLQAETQGLSSMRMQSMLLRKLDQLGQNEGASILQKMQGVETTELDEQNRILLMLIRADCEVRQSSHNHQGPTILEPFSQPEELQQQDSVVSEAAKKARRSLAGLTGIMKRQSSVTEANWTDSTTIVRVDQERNNNNSKQDAEKVDSSPQQSEGSNIGEKHVSFNQPQDSEPGGRRRARTLSSSSGEALKKELRIKKMMRLQSAPLYEEEEQPQSCTKAVSPQVSIFKKTGSNIPRTLQNASTSRQHIFNTVTTPVKKLDCVTKSATVKNYRELWKTAIKQQILLNRMEKQNKKMQEEKDQLELKRLKLKYSELVTVNDNLNIEQFIKKENADAEEICSYLKSGVSKHRRGDIWKLLLHAKCKTSGNDCDNYDNLKSRLTPHQHSILIDLARTFPSYGYFSRPLGTGQLAMYNVLKAYSLFDPEVGYCQGLPFLVGILLLHFELESEVFLCVKYLMYDMNMRTMFTSDMSGLQICLYQLTRLLLDCEPQIYQHFDKLSFDPSLYGTPWFLSLFAANFCIGFVSRVLDLVMMEGTTAIIKIGACLLCHFKDDLIKHNNVEDLISFIKTDIPAANGQELESIISRAANWNVESQLQVFKVEYTVIQEELSLNGGATNTDLLNQNKMLKNENDDLKGYISSLEETISKMRQEMEAMKKEARTKSCQKDEEQLEERLREEALLAAKRKLSLG